jgi:hypothetical protein
MGARQVSQTSKASRVEKEQASRDLILVDFIPNLEQGIKPEIDSAPYNGGYPKQALGRYTNEKWW